MENVYYEKTMHGFQLFFALKELTTLFHFPTFCSILILTWNFLKLQLNKAIHNSIEKLSSRQ